MAKKPQNPPKRVTFQVGTRQRPDFKHPLAAYVFDARGELIEPAHLPVLGTAAAAPGPANALTIAPGMTVDEAEQKLIVATLAAAGGNKTRAAEMLGISLKTLHNKLNRFKDESAKGA